MPRRVKDPNRVERGPKINDPVCIGEEVKVGIQLAIQRFRLDPTQNELSFPSSLSPTERAFVHRTCQQLGSLKTWSRGSYPNRYITIAKGETGKSVDLKPSIFSLVQCETQVANLLQKFPVTAKEKQDLSQSQRVGPGSDARDKGSFGRLTQAVPLVPPRRNESGLSSFRETLPVYKMRGEVIETIKNNQVILIAGETGCGKTTQVPQLILDQCHENKAPCRIICTQPRRIAAISISERVAAERGERIGQTVGYQIRLESKVSPKTLLTFCTNGVLLRTLMNGDSILQNITHIILDEIHERDRFSDFLLLCIKESLSKYPNLHIVLMSATLNMDLFSGYFNNCPVVCVPGNLYPVEEFFLEDILKWTGYRNRKMDKALQKNGKDEMEKLSLWCSEKVAITSFATSGTEEESDVTTSDNTELGEEKDDLEPWVTEEMDRLLRDIWLTGNDSLFHQILHLISSENVSVDYIQSETGTSPLMIASGRGFINVVEHLLSLGANVNLRTSTNWTALDFARKFDQQDICELLEAHSSSMCSDLLTPEEGDGQLVSAEDRQLLTAYQQSFDDEKVDIELVVQLLLKIESTHEEGAILVFLPGYDDIVSVRTSIMENASFEPSRHVVYALHSAIQNSDQKQAFKVPPRGVRKIILATNIAETSVTINDVVFVLDCGKVKEKSFDALTSLTMLKSSWVSKASALQRKGRAGRCQAGKCYHFFSRPRYVHLQDYQTPEILRLPLQELCLQTKLLVGSRESIADFLNKCPQAPPTLVIQNSIRALKQLDALDEQECMTEIGYHLSDLPIAPRLGKMILYSVILKCLDPVLTIVCSLAYKDPFVLPTCPSHKRAMLTRRRKFAEDTYSDHMTLLRAFQCWQKAKAEGWERAYCDKNFISSASMEMLVGMRNQVMGQLRATGFLRARGPGDIRDLNTNSENWSLVKGCLVAGSYPNIIHKKDKNELCTDREASVRLSNNSVLLPPSCVISMVLKSTWKKIVKNLPTIWFVYDEMSRLRRYSLAKCVSGVSAASIFFFAGPSRLEPEAVKESRASPVEKKGDDDSDSGEEEVVKSKNPTPCVKLDDWLTFNVDNQQTSSLAVQLRIKWHSLFLSRMKHPSKPWSQSDEAVLHLMVMILGNADKQLGLDNPVGVGQRPRQIGGSESMYAGNFDDYYRHHGNMGVHHHQQQQQQQQFYPQQPQHHHQQHQQHQQHQFSRGPNPHRPHSGQQRKGSTQNYSKNSSFQQSKGNGNGNGNGNDSRPKSSSPGLSQFIAQTSTASTSEGHSGNGDAAVGASCYYYVMKCNNQRRLENSQRKSLWATSGVNEAKLNKAFQSGKTVYLIFSVQGSGHFQGFAKMTSLIGKEKSSDFLGHKISGVFNVEWQKRANIPFQMTQHLMNPWNENRKVQISRDGTEIEPSVGAILLKLFDSFPNMPKRPESGGSKQQQKAHHSSRHQGQQNHQQAAKREREASPGGSARRSQGAANLAGVMATGAGGTLGPDSSKQASSSSATVMILQRTANSPPA